MNKEGTIYTIIFTFITAFLFVFLLAAANESTKEIVQKNLEIQEKGSILRALGIEATEEEVLNKYDSQVTEKETENLIYTAQVDGEQVYAQKFSGPGLWGTITGVLAVDSSVNRIQGLEIISHNETPGLGGRITEDWFTDQFRDQAVPGDMKIQVNQGSGKGDPVKEDDRVDAITGASRTSDYIEALVNRELQSIKKRLEVLK